MATAIVIQHLEPEGPARIGAALGAAGADVEVRRVDLGAPVPTSLDGIDALVVLGGPMSARHDEDFPSRIAEIELLRAAVASGVPTLGVCLGAQLLAAASGAEVRAGHGPEIGWGSIELLPSAAGDPLFDGLPHELGVLHWHGETYTLPDAAAHLARSDAYDQQAFRVGHAAWGLQFHVEVDPDEVEVFVDAFGEDAALARGGAEGIRSATAAAIEALRPHRELLLARFAGLAAVGRR